jgi:hypothetical protein
MPKKFNPFRVTLKQLERRRQAIINHPLYSPELGEDLSDEGLAKKLVSELNHVVYARDVSPPLENLEPGATVILDYDGMLAKWLNGTIFIRRDILEKQQQQTEQHQPKGTRCRGNS